MTPITTSAHRNTGHATHASTAGDHRPGDAAPAGSAHVLERTAGPSDARGRLAYDDTGGPGPLVVAVPGLGDLRQSYRRLAPRLAAAGYRMVTADLRGMGDSSAAWSDYSAMAIGDDLLALVRHLDAGPAVLVGNSHGGGAAAWAAAEAPELVRALVLLDPFVHDPALSPLVRGALRLALAGPWGRAAWLALFDHEFAAPPADHTAYRARLAANLRESGRMAGVRGMFWAPKAPVAARLAAVRAPTLVVMGAKDPDFPDPAAEAREVEARLTGAAVVETDVLPGVGHYPHVEAPDAVAARMLAFLSACLGGTAAATR